MAKLRLAPSLRHGQRSAAVARVRRTSRRVSLAGRIRTYTEEAPPGPVASPTGYLAADRSPGFARGWEPRPKNGAPDPTVHRYIVEGRIEWHFLGLLAPDLIPPDLLYV